VTAQDLSFEYPEGYRDEAALWESKGFVYVDVLEDSGERFRFFLIEPARLAQETAEVNATNPYFESNLVVIDRIVQPTIEMAIRSILNDSRNLVTRLESPPPPRQSSDR
jgi:hypothetical protein